MFLLCFSEKRYDHLQQVFITKNPILVSETDKLFQNYCHTYRYYTKQRNSIENNPLPTRIQEIPSERFPLFVTSRQFLLMLDASLPGESYFFDEYGEKKFDIPGWTFDPHLNTLTDFDQDFDEAFNPVNKSSKHIPEEVTFDKFVEIVWPLIKNKGLLQDMHPSLVWTEIMSFIKGSQEAMLSTDAGYLSLEQYQLVGKKQAVFSDEQIELRKTVYIIFMEYQKMLKDKGWFDETDILFKLHRRCPTRFINEWCVHELYIDETQDFTQAELSLFLNICHNPNKVFMTGDTAQTIMRGVTFRFQELTTMFHKLREQLQPIGIHPQVEIPKVQILQENYRSHEGILNMAFGVVSVMKHFFPQSFDDFLPRDIGSLPGPKPVLLESITPESLAIVLRGNASTTTQVELGANQAILVVNDSAREQLPEILQAGIVLTIYEAKGLEFDDVLLYNFFNDSASVSFLHNYDLMNAFILWYIFHNSFSPLCYDYKK